MAAEPLTACEVQLGGTGLCDQTPGHWTADSGVDEGVLRGEMVIMGVEGSLAYYHKNPQLSVMSWEEAGPWGLGCGGSGTLDHSSSLVPAPHSPVPG